MKKPLKDLSKSVHDRLLTLAKRTERTFTEVMQLYAMERFLYRLSRSKHADNFVLKGGMMLRVWNAPITRPTKDVDLLGRTTKNTIANLVSIVQEICDEDVEPDGMRFDPATAVGSTINEDAEYNGIRVKFIGLLGVSRASMQIDVGFGDAVVPSPVEIEVPPLLDFPAPKLHGYQRDTAIAEKLHAMVVLGMTNTRMKDFYDLWLLAENFDFDGEQLASAIKATFAARTEPSDADPIALTPAFSDAAQARWTSFLKKSTLTNVPESFSSVVRVIRQFLLPLLQGRGAGHWSKGGPWA